MELSRQLRDVHLVIHPLLDVARDITGALQEVRPVAVGEVEDGSPRRRPRVVDARRDRPDPRRRGHRGDRGVDPAGAARRPRGRRGLGEDARPGRRRSSTSWRPGRRPRSTPRRRARRRDLLQWLADGPLHVPRLPRVPRSSATARTSSSAASPGTGLGILRADQDLASSTRPAARAGRGQGPRADRAGADQGQLALDRSTGRRTSTTSASRSSRTARWSASAASSASTPAPPTPSR